MSQGGTNLYGHGVSDPSGQQFEHFHVAAQQAQCVGAGMGLFVCVFVAEGVDDVHHDGRRVRHCVRLSVCWLPHFVPLYRAVGKRKTTCFECEYSSQAYAIIGAEGGNTLHELHLCF